MGREGRKREREGGAYAISPGEAEESVAFSDLMGGEEVAGSRRKRGRDCRRGGGLEEAPEDAAQDGSAGGLGHGPFFL